MHDNDETMSAELPLF